MSIHLLPCPSCARHVRASERACPFCEAGLDPAAASARGAPRAPGSRLGRAATFAFGAAVATTLQVTGCAKSETRAPDAGGEVDAGGVAPAYGAPVLDAGAGDDAGAPVDAGAQVDGGTEVDAGGPGPLYGGPAPLDGGGPVPAYGAPPDS